MAGASNRYVKSKNPFLDDDEELQDVDDDLFLRKAPAKPPPSSSAFNLGARNKYSNLSGMHDKLLDQDEFQDPDERRRQLLLEKKQIEERTLESSQRSVAVLHETEAVGASAAEELIRQREQLVRTGARLDEMNNSLRSSEKHIQNIKSVFSSIKNYFSKPSEPLVPAAPKSESSAAAAAQPQGRLERVLERGPERGDSASVGQPHSALGSGTDVDRRLDENLGVMSASLSRLKGLAQGLNDELEDQNELLDRLQGSADKADWRIQRQNKDMERLLKK